MLNGQVSADMNRRETPLGIVLLIMGVLIVTTPTKADVTRLNVS
jgi:hypothetical protein